MSKLVDEYIIGIDMRIQNEWEDIRKGKALGWRDGSVIKRMC